MSRKHALLSPSSAERWMACPPSARLTEGIYTQSKYADEGTLAHDLAELLLKDKLGLIKPGSFAADLIVIQRSEHYSKAMYEHCSDYADIVCEKFNAYKAQGYQPVIQIETQIDYSYYVPQGSGYLDCTIITSKHITVIDLKYGAGYEVSAKDNPQLKLYALGVAESVCLTHDIKEINLSIYQPRVGGLSEWFLTFDELMSWANDVVKPAASLAWNGEGAFKAGKHCMFCAVKATCKAFAEENLKTARVAFSDDINDDNKDPALLDDDEIVYLLRRFDMFKSWVSAVQEYALAEALNGKKWDGYKLVAGRADRKYKDPEAVKKFLTSRDFKLSQITETNLLGITAMETFLGKKLFNSLLKNFVVKPKGKPTLVVANDPRAEYSTVENAQKVFTDEPLDDFG